QPRRGQDHHRSLAAVLQHREATLVAWIQATGTRGHHLACASKRSSTVICPGNSPKADHELRLKPDHPMGSGHPSGGYTGRYVAALPSFQSSYVFSTEVRDSGNG